MKSHFQVVVTDKRDYINEYRNFDWCDITPMLKYIEAILKTRKDSEGSTIKITRWNENGERI